MFGSIEVINKSVNSVFTNTAENDLAFYTSTSNQSLHLGTTQNQLSTLVISPSNLQINGDLSLRDRRVNFTRLSVARPTAIGTPTNVTSVVSNNTAQIAPQNGNNYDFMLSNANTNFRFLDSNGQVEASVTNTGNMLLAGNISAGNLGMFRNRIINGDMRINQRGANSNASITNQAFLNDRWFHTGALNSGVGAVTCSNVLLTTTDTPYSVGLKRSMRCTVATAFTSVNHYYSAQRIEGVNIDDLNWGTTQGSSVTASLWYRTNLASGSTLQFTLRNPTTNVAYNTVVTTGTSGAWSYQSFVVPAPASGSVWNTDSNVGIEFMIGAVGLGKTGAVGTWTTDISTTTNWVATQGNYVEFTGVQLEKGTLATPFEFRPLAMELQLCQRYYINEQNTSGFISRTHAAFNNMYLNGILRQIMRASPAVSVYYDISDGANAVSPANFTSILSWALSMTGLTPGAWIDLQRYTADAEL